MRRFVLKMLLLVLVVFSPPVLVLLLVSPQYTHGYNAALLDKVRRLESISEPKIMIVSDSNVAFGVRSDMIEEVFGMPVVNLGLHGGLGHVFHERLPLFNVRRGDVVVVSHLTYDDDDTILDPALALVAVENHFRLWRIFRAKDYPRVLAMLPTYAYKCLARFVRGEDREPDAPECYARSSFNEYGDNVFPRFAGEEAPAFTRYPAVGAACARRIDRLGDWCAERGAAVVIAGAPIVSGLPGFNEQFYVDFQAELERSVRCPVISDFTDYFFGAEYFYGGAFHMTNEGAAARTRQLVADLRRYFEGRPSAAE